MKSLFIVRHAKSSWDYPELADYQRPLLNKGIKRTQGIANYLVKKGVKVDLMISSHAVRAYETAKIIAEVINYPTNSIIQTEEFYGASIYDLNAKLKKVPDHINSVMIFGHNPTFTSFSNQFIKQKIDWLPTSGVVAIKFRTESWEKFEDAKWSLDFLISPKMLRDSK